MYIHTFIYTHFLKIACKSIKKKNTKFPCTLPPKITSVNIWCISFQIFALYTQKYIPYFHNHKAIYKSQMNQIGRSFSASLLLKNNYLHNSKTSVIVWLCLLFMKRGHQEMPQVTQTDNLRTVLLQGPRACFWCLSRTNSCDSAS